MGRMEYESTQTKGNRILWDARIGQIIAKKAL
jgi:hypothetical protein